MAIDLSDPVVVARVVEEIVTRTVDTVVRRGVRKVLTERFAELVVPHYVKHDPVDVRLRDNLGILNGCCYWEGDWWVIEAARAPVQGDALDTLWHELGHLVLDPPAKKRPDAVLGRDGFLDVTRYRESRGPNPSYSAEQQEREDLINRWRAIEMRRWGVVDEPGARVKPPTIVAVRDDTFLARIQG